MNHQKMAPILIFPILLLLWGCWQNSLTIQVRYGEVSGLKQDDPVYFEQNTVGKVVKVTYTQQGDYLVEIDITAEFANAATVDSKFFIAHDPQDRQGKAMVIVQDRSGGRVLGNGAIVEGSVKAGFLAEIISDINRQTSAVESEMRQAIQQLEKSLRGTSQQLNKELADALNDLTRQFQTFSEEMKNVPDSREVEQLAQSVKQFADAFNRAQGSVRDRLRDEVLPQLRNQLNQLREQLREKGREGEIEVIDRHVQEMSRA